VSACGWQADEGIIAHRGDCLKCHVAGSLDSPFIVLFEQQRTDQAHDGFIVGKDADDLCPPLDLAVQSLDRVGNRYKICGADVRLRFCGSWRMV
jgi:hypothetical protein